MKQPPGGSVLPGCDQALLFRRYIRMSLEISRLGASPIDSYSSGRWSTTHSSADSPFVGRTGRKRTASQWPRFVWFEADLQTAAGRLRVSFKRPGGALAAAAFRSEEHTSELQSLRHLV